MIPSAITNLPPGIALTGTEVAPFDQSGNTVAITANQIRTFIIASQTIVTVAGTVTMNSASAPTVLVNVAGLVTVKLPDVTAWAQGLLIVKDLGGNAANFNITVSPFAGQAIDGLAQSFVIVQSRQFMRLYPMSNLTGWFNA